MKKIWVYIDFQCFCDQSLKNYGAFLGELVGEIADRLNFKDSIGDAVTFPRQQKFSRFVRDEILRRLDKPVVLAFDEVDRLLGCSWQSDFFAMLRSWHNDRAMDKTWRKTDLALVIATEPYLLIDRPDQSPFNVVPPTNLGPFGQREIEAINLVYGSLLSADELQQLVILLGGHPFLTRLAFYRLKTVPGLTFQGLIDDASRLDGPFADHLRAKLLHLQRNPLLLQTLQRLVRQQVSPDQESFWRLHGAGLVNLDSNNKMAPANMLYARFFRDVV